MQQSVNEDLIARIRQLNSVFSKATTQYVPLPALCQELCNIIECNIYLFDTAGTFIACSIAKKFLCPYTEPSLQSNELPRYYLELFRSHDDPVIRIFEERPACTYKDVKSCIFANRFYSLYPIYSNFKKSAGLLLIRYGSVFSDTDAVLCEYVCAIVSLELMRLEQARVQALDLERAVARRMMETFSSSELKAVEAVLEAVGREDGNVFFNAIAEKAFVTRSLVSSSLKMLEGAGLISTQGHGVRGKTVRLKNRFLLEELYRAEILLQKKQERPKQEEQ